jgi:quercetin dioxygenase-like cupin family protein
VNFIAQTGDICLDQARAREIGPATFEKLAAGCARAGIDLLPTHVATEPAAQQTKPQELWVLGTHVRILLTSQQTGGQFTVAEITTQPGDFVPPHRHVREDEIFYVLTGEYEFDLRDGIINAPAGTFVYVPKQSVHGFRNCGTTAARMLDIHTPGGFEKFFTDAGTPCTDVRKGAPKMKLEMNQLVRLFEKHGMEM